MLESLFTGASASKRIAVIVAHPDDEIIGAGGQLRRWTQAHVVYVTDGVPRNGCDARDAGFGSVAAYAVARRNEAAAALALAGIPPARTHRLGFVDQETSFHLAELVRSLTELIEVLRPEVLLTQPYEGGHPDHDSTAFAVQAAVGAVRARDFRAPDMVEMSSYHNGGGFGACDFLPGTQRVSVQLSAEEQAFKRRLFECFPTQERVLRQFPLAVERFRRAPVYDFTSAPHEGELFYERFPWGIDGAQWRALAAEAARSSPRDARAAVRDSCVC